MATQFFIFFIYLFIFCLGHAACLEKWFHQPQPFPSLQKTYISKRDFQVM